MYISIDQTKLVWTKAAKSATGNCIEVAKLDNGTIAVRDSKLHGEGPVLQYTKSEWAAFLDGARKGEFDAFAN